jgi:hypothetical protein
MKLLPTTLTAAVSVALGMGCAHAGAATAADEEAAVAEGVRAALRLYSPGKELPAGPYCIEVANAPSDFERGVVASLAAAGIDAVAMAECSTGAKDAVFWVKVQSYGSTDWIQRAEFEVQGTVETRPDQQARFRLGWFRATFHASLGYRDGRWVTLAADDLGRI